MKPKTFKELKKEMEQYSVIDAILLLCDNNMYPLQWRKGQALFNMCETIYPKEVNTLRGTEYDCFHNVNNIEVFIDKVKELIKSDVSGDNLIKLQNAQAKLHCLETTGVNEWEGYDVAMAEYNKQNH